MKRTFSALLSAVLCLSLAAPASAAGAVKAIHLTAGASPYVYINGADVIFLTEKEGRMGRVEPLSYNGTTYIPLTTASSWLGANGIWDGEKNGITFTGNGKEPFYYDFSFLDNSDLDFPEAQGQLTANSLNETAAWLYADTALTVNGQSRNAISSLLFQGELYLPLPGMAELMGKQFLRFGNDLHLYDAPTQKELAQVRTYLSHLRDRLKAVRTLVTGDAPRTEEEFLSLIRQTQDQLMAVWEVPVPAFAPMTPYIEKIQFYTLLILNDKVDFYLPEAEASGTSQALEDRLGIPWKRAVTIFPMTFEENWECFTSEMVTDQYGVITYLTELEGWCSTAEGFIEAVRSALPDNAFAADPATYTDAALVHYRDAVDTLSRLGVISGREDGSFDPQGLVTRAECAKLLVAMRCGGNSERIPPHSGAPAFSDIEGHWAEDHITYAYKSLDLLSGRGDGTFDPDAPVTGPELAKMALTALGYDPTVYQLVGSNWDSNTNRVSRFQCKPSLYDGLGEDVAVSKPITREIAAQILFNMLYNGVMEAVPNQSENPDEVTFQYVPKKDENGQAVSFLSTYFGLSSPTELSSWMEH